MVKLAVVSNSMPVDFVVWMSVPAVSISAPKIVPSSIWRTLAGMAGLAAFFVALSREGTEVEHHPRHGPIELEVPGRVFGA